MSDKRKRAYRYEVTDTWGEGTKAMGGKPNILDWKYFGEEYTWAIMALSGRTVGTITGRFIDKGWCEGGKYKSDAELAAA